MTSVNGTHPHPTVRMRGERHERPLDPGAFYLLLRVTAPEVRDRERERPPLDLAFVVDRSGSMAGGAFELARAGVEHALRLLDGRDSVSLVVYDDQIDTLQSQRLLDRESRDTVERRLRQIGPRGSTDLAGGWLTGCDQLAPLVDGTRRLREDGARSLVRALLLSDGLANVGMTDAGEIARHAAELARRGISTTTFGVGAHYDEELLAGMADAGQGHFHHIPTARSIPDVFAGELGEMLQVALRDVVLELRFPKSWRARLLNDLPIEHRDGWTSLRLGELHSSESRALLWELDLPPAVDGQRDTIDIRLSWCEPDGTRSFEDILTHDIAASHFPGEPDAEVQEELARMLGAQARVEAIRFNKLGQYDQALASVRRAVAAMPASAAGRAMAGELMREVAPVVARQADPAELKRHYAYSRNVRRSRRDYSEQR
jgi:Ca-activated chloride channel family protein